MTVCYKIFLLLFLEIISTNALMQDTAARTEMEKVIKDDYFSLTLNNITWAKDCHSGPETILLIKIKSEYFDLQIDCERKNLIIETLEEGNLRSQYFSIDSLNDKSDISMTLLFNQQQPDANIILEIDCESYGRIETPKTLREMYLFDPYQKLLLLNEYSVNIKPGKKSMDNCASPTDKLKLLHLHNLDVETTVETFNKLVDVVNTMYVDLSGLIKNCTGCNAKMKCKSNPCLRGVKCVETKDPPYFKCLGCPEGFTGDGFNCTDIDECADGRNGGCTLNSECQNTEGSFICGACKLNFLGNQTVGCRPMESSCFNGIQCDKHAFCDYSTYICRCNVGWAGDGHECGVDQDHDGYPDEALSCNSTRCKKDNCPTAPNSGQEDSDKDGIGDMCDPDADKDGINNKQDNCIYVANPKQENVDGDLPGDVCDNCPNISNSYQEDTDNDGIGDACDDDIDNDGIQNLSDNCPYISNKDQTDSDKDKVGDVCDNCPFDYNPNQEDSNGNEIGDECDSESDIDNDGIPDHLDNCPKIPNTDQQDTDNDRKGDACAMDADGDGIVNGKDNCPLVVNKDQLDSNYNGIGNACENDWDADGIPNENDVCPYNSKIHSTNFTSYKTLNLDPIGTYQNDPLWIILNHGAEIKELLNSDPGLAVGNDVFRGVDYEGTMYIDDKEDDDFMGVIFSYQSTHKFYAVLWKKHNDSFANTTFKAVSETGISIKIIDSDTGPGTTLGYSLWHKEDVSNQTKVLWSDPKKLPWKEQTAYRWHLVHRPLIGLIRLRIFDKENMVVDSGNLFDTTLRGGRLGVYCYSQELIYWSNLVYRCADEVPQYIYNELSHDKIQLYHQSLPNFYLHDKTM